MRCAEHLAAWLSAVLIGCATPAPSPPPAAPPLVHVAAASSLPPVDQAPPAAASPCELLAAAPAARTFARRAYGDVVVLRASLPPDERERARAFREAGIKRHEPVAQMLGRLFAARGTLTQLIHGLPRTVLADLKPYVISGSLSNVNEEGGIVLAALSARRLRVEVDDSITVRWHPVRDLLRPPDPAYTPSWQRTELQVAAIISVPGEPLLPLSAVSFGAVHIDRAAVHTEVEPIGTALHAWFDPSLSPDAIRRAADTLTTQLRPGIQVVANEDHQQLERSVRLLTAYCER